MDNREREIIITLEDLWEIFIRRFLLMLIVAVVAMGGVFAFNTLTFVPKYHSKATLYVLKQNDKDNHSVSGDNFSLALNVVKDCTYIIKSRDVLEDVIAQLGLDMDYKTLSSSLTITNPSNTRILEVQASSDSPELSKKIADCVCETGAKKIEETMGFNQVNLYEEGTLESTPYNKTSLITYAEIGVFSAALVYAFFILRFLLDDKIRSTDDIEDIVGISVIGVIPNADTSQKGHSYYAQHSKSKYE